ncbi:MAG: DUF4292 domain-containing protein [Thermodesulfobacteriota bacterium]|nr:DUF4292 domain-containing protein [Thermodesulfobacteriota bacterium]
MLNRFTQKNIPGLTIRWLWYFFLFNSLLMMSGCTKNLPEYSFPGFRENCINTAVEDIKRRNNRIHTVSGYGRISIRDNQESYQAKTAILIQKPTLWRIDFFYTPFSIPISSLFTDGNEILLMFLRENKGFKGKFTSENLSSFVPFGLTLEEVVTILSGGIPLQELERLNMTVMEEENTKIRVDLEKHKYLVLSLNKEKGLITEASCFLKGYLKFTVIYEDFTLIEDIYFPHIIRISGPYGFTIVTLNYMKVDMNTSIDSERFRLTVPKNMEITSLDN